MTEWPSDQVTEWPSDRVTEWPSDRVTGSFADDWPYGIFDLYSEYRKSPKIIFLCLLMCKEGSSPLWHLTWLVLLVWWLLLCVVRVTGYGNLGNWLAEVTAAWASCWQVEGGGGTVVPAIVSKHQHTAHHSPDITILYNIWRTSSTPCSTLTHIYFYFETFAK